MKREEFVVKLLALGRRNGDIPIYGSAEWESLDRLDPRRFAAVVAAAECWRREGTYQGLHDKFDEEIHFNNWFAAWRLRAMSNDLAAAFAERRTAA